MFETRLRISSINCIKSISNYEVLLLLGLLKTPLQILMLCRIITNRRWHRRKRSYALFKFLSQNYESGLPTTRLQSLTTATAIFNIPLEEIKRIQFPEHHVRIQQRVNRDSNLDYLNTNQDCQLLDYRMWRLQQSPSNIPLEEIKRI
jgi:hypothetical protein